MFDFNKYCVYLWVSLCLLVGCSDPRASKGMDPPQVDRAWPAERLSVSEKRSSEESHENGVDRTGLVIQPNVLRLHEFGRRSVCRPEKIDFHKNGLKGYAGPVYYDDNPGVVAYYSVGIRLEDDGTGRGELLVFQRQVDLSIEEIGDIEEIFKFNHVSDTIAISIGLEDFVFDCKERLTYSKPMGKPLEFK